jgi:uncharacterized protein
VNNPFGITDNSYSLILKTIAKFPEIEKAVIFGSRAMGNYKKGSDIDLAVFGQNIDLDRISGLQSILNQRLPIPYHVDMVHFDTVENKELQDHINDVGIEIWSGDQ